MHSDHLREQGQKCLACSHETSIRGSGCESFRGLSVHLCAPVWFGNEVNLPLQVEHVMMGGGLAWLGLWVAAVGGEARAKGQGGGVQRGGGHGNQSVQAAHLPSRSVWERLARADVLKPAQPLVMRPSRPCTSKRDCRVAKTSSEASINQMIRTATRAPPPPPSELLPVACRRRRVPEAVRRVRGP